MSAVSGKFDTEIAELRSSFLSGKTRDLKWRKSQLQQLKKILLENDADMATAIHQDLGGPKLRTIAEFGFYKEADYFLSKLDSWNKGEKVPSETMLGSARIRNDPKGVMLLIAPWNYPINLIFKPLAAMIACGNCVLIKPSEITPNVSTLVTKLVNKYLDTSCIKVVEGGVPETTELLTKQWDHILYTGNGTVGKIIAAAAAKHLTPTTLELGGKSPTIVDKSARLQTAVDRISMGKWLNCGQTCIAPDTMIVHNSVKDKVASMIISRISDCYGEDPMTSKDYGRIVSQRHVSRLCDLIANCGGTVLAGGADKVSDKYFPPTVVMEPSAESNLLKEEIFGPIIPIIGFDTIEEAITISNRICSQPLALYIFSENKSNIEKVLSSTQSGGVCVNTTMEHTINHHLPFGGVGSSGLGAYHGVHGLREFSHQRAVVTQDTFLNRGTVIPLPPYPDFLYKFALLHLTGILTDTQRSVLKAGIATVTVAVLGRFVSNKLKESQ
eukprot:TRINITY_DN10589_c0_g1_i1.p1 TRINITY_DN10589_c0_g1~~TRINITY_DN10589_c0_g1_i1.p1  ORF type:complete len:498 (+),score=77.95 TRINITY_DN10589_c0_g1_i1:50-1543(+)